MGDSKGRWVWHEVMTTDADKGRAYYEAMFGWTAETMQMGPDPYVMFKAGQAPVTGMMAAQGGAPSHWLAYVDVGDVDAATSRVPGLGGEVLVPPYDIPKIGRASLVKDNTGGVVSFFQSAPDAGEGRDFDAPPAPFSVCWTELMTSDIDKACGFYGELVGWTSEAMGPEMRVLKVGDKAVGSVRGIPPGAEGMPPYWMSYVLVPDVAEYQAKSEGLGGKTLMGDTEIPGMGRFATIQDPTGAVYSLWTEAAPSK